MPNNWPLFLVSMRARIRGLHHGDLISQVGRLITRELARPAELPPKETSFRALGDLMPMDDHVGRSFDANLDATATDFHDRKLDAISDDDGFFRLSAENEHANLRIGDWGCTDGGHDAKGVPEGRQLDMSATQN